METPYEPRPWEKIEGLYLVTFLNDKNKQIDVKANVINGHALPLYLVDVNNVIYNWMTIVSIKKVEN